MIIFVHSKIDLTNRRLSPSVQQNNFYHPNRFIARLDLPGFTILFLQGQRELHTGTDDRKVYFPCSESEFQSWATLIADFY